MPQLEGLNLQVSADVKDLLKGLADGKKNIIDFAESGEASLQTLGDAYKVLQQAQQKALGGTADFRKYSTALKEIEGARKGLVTLASQDLPKISSASNTAGQSLQNLGRIAQDAPFGFIGIQNNINPLIESFGRLRAETGSNKEAFKALFSSLGGVAGIGLAVSVLTSVLTVLTQNGFFKSAEGADKAAEALKKHKEAVEADKKAVDSIFSSVAKEVVNVQSIITVLNSEVATRERKLDALRELKKIQPDIFDGVRLEGDAVIGLNAAYAAYLQQIKTVIAVKIKQQQLEKVTEEILKREGVTLTEQEKRYKEAGQAIVKGLEDRQNKSAAFADKQSTITANRVKDEKKAEAELLTLYKDQTALLKGISDLQDGIKIPDPKERAKKVKTIAGILAELRRNLQLLNAEELVFNTDESEKKIAEFKKALNSLTDIGIKPNNDIIKSLLSGVDSVTVQKYLQNEVFDNIQDLNLYVLQKKVAEQARKAFAELQVAASDALDELSNRLSEKALTPKVKLNVSEAIIGLTTLKLNAEKKGIRIPVDFYTSEKSQQSVAAQLQYLTVIEAALSAGVKEIAAGAAISLGEAFGAALNGNNFFKSFGNGLFKLIGNVVSNLGKTMLTLSPILAKIKVALTSLNPILAAGAGIALIAVGSALQNATKGFATGGFVSGPGTKTSDSIPANLSKGEFVVKAAAVDRLGVPFLNSINNGMVPQIPSSNLANASVPNIQGGITIYVEGELRGRGTDLVTVFNNQTRANAING